MIDKILFNNPQKITTGIQNTQVAIKKNKLIKVPNFLKIPMVILMQILSQYDILFNSYVNVFLNGWE